MGRGLLQLARNLPHNPSKQISPTRSAGERLIVSYSAVAALNLDLRWERLVHRFDEVVLR